MTRLSLLPAALLALVTWSSGVAHGEPQGPEAIYLPTAVAQTEADEYTRYELLAPDTASFRITYEVTATTAGAKFFYNPIRKGSVASDEKVLDATRRRSASPNAPTRTARSCTSCSSPKPMRSASITTTRRRVPV